MASQETQPQAQAQGQTPIQVAREKLMNVLNMLDRLVVGHEEVHKMLMVAVVAHENVVMISPPGTAKTYTVTTLAKLINAKFYSYLMTRFTSDIEVLGPYNVKKLTSDGVLERNWSNIINANIVFLDEVFKANSAILNALLSLLNERIIYDPMSGVAIPTKVISVIGASNEVPQDEELQALYDRFSIRIFMNYIDNDAMLLKALEARWLNNNNGIQPIASIDDINTLYEYSIKLIQSTIKGLGRFIDVFHANAIPYVMSLRSKGIIVSDRTIVEKLPKLLAAYCAIFGVTMENVVNGVLDILPYLAHSKDEVKAIKDAMAEALGPLNELMDKLNAAKNAIRSRNLKQAKEYLNEIINFDLAKLALTPWLKRRFDAIASEAQMYLAKINQIEKQLEELEKAENGGSQ